MRFSIRAVVLNEWGGGAVLNNCVKMHKSFFYFMPPSGEITPISYCISFLAVLGITLFFFTDFFFFFRHKEFNNSPISKRGPLQRKFGNHCKKRFANVLILFVCFMFVCHIPMNRDQINTGRNSTAVLQSKSNVGHAPSTPTMSATA